MTVGRRRFFADLSVNIKILAAIGVAVLVAITVGIVGLLALSSASASAQVISFNNVASIKAVGDIQSSTSQARLDLANHAISTDTATMDKYQLSALTPKYKPPLPPRKPALRPA